MHVHIHVYLIHIYEVIFTVQFFSTSVDRISPRRLTLCLFVSSSSSSFSSSPPPPPSPPHPPPPLQSAIGQSLRWESQWTEYRQNMTSDTIFKASQITTERQNQNILDTMLVDMFNPQAFCSILYQAQLNFENFCRWIRRR
jgi:hypothetical protein